MATTKLYRTFGTPTNLDKWTCSVWVKRTKIASEEFIFEGSSGASNFTDVRFDASDQIQFSNYNSGYLGKLVTNRLFRDLGAWYHIVAVWDSDNATPGDRMKLYVNGVEETSFATDTNPSSGEVCDMGSGSICYVGVHQVSNAYFTGVMAHLHFCDGQAYAASDFGETDATSGIWIAKSGPSVTYGDNGLFLKFASGAFGTDSSGNSNTMTVGGTMTATKDTPDNNFATWNLLQNYYDPATFANGNTKFTTTGSTGIHSFRTSTLGMSSGKWYCEILRGGTADWACTGIASRFPEASGDWLGNPVGNYSWDDWDGKVMTNNTTEVADWNPYDGDVIVMIGLDLDNNKLYLGQNGVWENSADPAGGTGGASISAPSDTFTGCYYFAAGDYDNGYGQIFNANFGNGYFGTTAVTSAVADGNGEGQFEYAPPTGFFALCTNNLGSES